MARTQNSENKSVTNIQTKRFEGFGLCQETAVPSLTPAQHGWLIERDLSPLGQDEFLMGPMKGSSGIGFSISLHEP